MTIRHPETQPNGKDPGMKAFVNEVTGIGCELCAQTCPEVFELEIL